MLKEIIIKIESTKQCLTVIRHAQKIGYRCAEKKIKYFFDSFAIVLNPNTELRHCDVRLYESFLSDYQLMKTEEFLAYGGGE